MKNKNTEQDFFSRILDGIRKASRKMAEKSAANNEDLIVADKNGNPISVPAKELLKNL
ncbi:MAG: hypothetical protein ACO1N7_11805 [Sphingobacteriaceae bacterium]